MSSNLMDTEIGGEQTQYAIPHNKHTHKHFSKKTKTNTTPLSRYESEHTDTVPHKKSGGQLGQAETSVDVQPDAAAKQKAERGEKTAENIRYGQAISESGVGGFTTGSEGSAAQEGVGRQQKQEQDSADAVQSRKAEGYGGEKDMDREIGA
jgi:hypothetical protein